MIIFKYRGKYLGFRDEDKGAEAADQLGATAHETTEGVLVCACEALGGVHPMAHFKREDAELHKKNIEGEGYDASIEEVEIIG